MESQEIELKLGRFYDVALPDGSIVELSLDALIVSNNRTRASIDVTLYRPTNQNYVVTEGVLKIKDPEEVNPIDLM